MPASIRLAPWRAALLSLGCGLALSSGAQSICSSDGQRAPSAVLERFIGADCEACWTASSPVPPSGATVLDWIVPSNAQGDDAPLSAASTRDSLNRLQALQWPSELAGRTFSQTLTRSGTAHAPGRLRVAHGVAVADYLGVSIEWRPTRGPTTAQGPWTAWLLLVERLPAGTEGSPIARQLVRNSLSLNLPSAPTRAWQERRAMRLPEGAQPERLALVGWLQDGRGRMVAINETVCENTPAPGSSR